MTWAIHHTDSEQLAVQAEFAIRQGDRHTAEQLYRQAAEAEERALQDLAPTKAKTFGITAVSASALWFKSGDLDAADRVIVRSLATPDLPTFAAVQLRQLLQRVWAEQEQRAAGVTFLPQDVLVSVKGGEVVRGGAPLDLIVEKVRGVQALFYRTLEMLLGRPHRRRGAADDEIQHMCRPWLIHAPAGSYQFAVRIQRPLQTELFPEPAPEVTEVASTFLSVLRASSEGADDVLQTLVADRDYRTTFLELARNLAPMGKTFSRLEVRAADEPHMQPIVLVPQSRKEMSGVLKKMRSTKTGADETIIQLRGILRGVQLDRDWLDVALADGRTVRVKGVSDGVDDVIGPMVNHRVVVEAVQVGAQSHEYRGIEPDE